MQAHECFGDFLADQVQELVYELDVLELVQSQECRNHQELVLAVQSHMVVWTEHLSATVHLLGVRPADHAWSKYHHLVQRSSMSVPSHLVQRSSMSVCPPSMSILFLGSGSPMICHIPDVFLGSGSFELPL